MSDYPKIITRPSQDFVPQVAGLLEHSTKPYGLLPARFSYPKAVAERLYRETRPQLRMSPKHIAYMRYFLSWPNVKLSEVIDKLWNATENIKIVNNFMYNNLIRSMAFFPNNPKNLAAFKE